jgi:hypothetical protein
MRRLMCLYWLLVSLGVASIVWAAWPAVNTPLPGSSGQILYNNAGSPGAKTLTCSDLSDAGSLCTSSSAGPSAANPTATISGTAVNGSASTYLRSDGAPALGTAAKTRSFGASFDGNGAALVAGNSVPFEVPFACTISAYNIAVSTADTATFKVWKVATGTAIPTSGNSINTSGVSISSNTNVRSSTVSDFTTTAVAANDLVIIQLSSVGGTTTGAAFTVECTL